MGWVSSNGGRRLRWAWPVLFLCLNPVPPAGGQATVSLAPAVIMASGTYGQSLTQRLTVSNQTGQVFDFQMVAEDIVAQNGKRVFLPAGQADGSIAATAVFVPQEIVAPPNSSESVTVTVTIPPKTAIRAIAAIFRAKSATTPTGGSVGLLASMGTLMTFNLSDNVGLAGDPPEVHLPTATTNLSFDETLTNTGTEPLLPKGVAAILNDAGKLVGKVSFPGGRLLPGEKHLYHAEFTDSLKAGHYRVLCTFEYEHHAEMQQGEFTIP